MPGPASEQAGHVLCLFSLLFLLKVQAAGNFLLWIVCQTCTYVHKHEVIVKESCRPFVFEWGQSISFDDKFLITFYF